MIRFNWGFYITTRARSSSKGGRCFCSCSCATRGTSRCTCRDEMFRSQRRALGCRLKINDGAQSSFTVVLFCQSETSFKRYPRSCSGACSLSDHKKGVAEIAYLGTFHTHPELFRARPSGLLSRARGSAEVCRILRLSGSESR